jgi:hypothetical protein
MTGRDWLVFKLCRVWIGWVSSFGECKPSTRLVGQISIDPQRGVPQGTRAGGTLSAPTNYPKRRPIRGVPKRSQDQITLPSGSTDWGALKVGIWNPLFLVKKSLLSFKACYRKDYGLGNPTPHPWQVRHGHSQRGTWVCHGYKYISFLSKFDWTKKLTTESYCGMELKENTNLKHWKLSR